MVRGSREALLSAPPQRHTHTSEERQKQVRATSTPTQRTTTPDARPLTAHLVVNASNTSFKCALTQSARCRRRHSCPRFFPWWKSVFYPSLMCSAPLPQDSAWVIQSSSTWAIQLLASQTDRAVDREFMSFLSWVTILWVFLRHSGAHPPRRRKFPRHNAAADTLHKTMLYENTSRHPAEYEKKTQLKPHCSYLAGFFCVLQGAGAGPCTCHETLRALCILFRKKTSQHHGNMQVESLNLHVVLVHAVCCWW